MCRILKKLAAYDLIEGRSSSTDQRAREWELTKHGRGFALSIERKCRDRARVRVDFLVAEERRRLLVAMSIVENVLLAREVYRL
jgi:DNA-binding MarR family transcriptional regulator